MGKAGNVLSGAASGASTGAAFGPYGAAIGGVIGGLAGLFASDDASAAEKEAAAARQRIIQEIQALEIPSIEKQEIMLERLEQAGLLSVELEQSIQQDPSAFETIELNPDYEQAQLGTLRALDELAESGGLTDEDKLKRSELEEEVSATGSAQRERSIQSARERGVGGSGLEYAEILAGDQHAQTLAAKKSRELSATAEDRALKALIERGEYAGDIRTQEYGEQENLASARDQINKYNTGLLSNREGANVNRRNAASKFNLERGQTVADKNVGLGNTEQLHNKALIRKNYEDRLAKLKLKADATMGNVNQNVKDARRRDQDSAGDVSTFLDVADKGVDLYKKTK